MRNDRQDIVIMAELDWGGLHCQSHVVARGFAAAGHRVYYINRTLQRWPKWRHLITRLRPKPSLGVRQISAVPEGITLVNLWVGPPVRWLRWLNRMLMRRTVKRSVISQPLFITYVPTYNCIDLVAMTGARCLSYICYHNFDADIVLKDVLRAEKEVIANADLLFADSLFLVERLRKISCGREVNQAPPGVYFDLFSKAWRGDEVNPPRRICFFGGAGPHLDLDTYNRLCDICEVHFIAVVQPSIRNLMDPRIRVTDPVENEKLPGLLREMDVLTILYLPSPYIEAVLPAKFFECIATGKPVLVSGIPEAGRYADCVYDTRNDPEQAVAIVSSLGDVHTAERVNRQFALGRDSDFSRRFAELSKTIFDTCPD
jgi:glycosyltransferase involved in cell wall biosynthesis